MIRGLRLVHTSDWHLGHTLRGEVADLEVERAAGAGGGGGGAVGGGGRSGRTWLAPAGRRTRTGRLMGGWSGARGRGAAATRGRWGGGISIMGRARPRNQKTP